MTARVAPDRWRRRRRADEHARWRRQAERLASALDRPLAPWQIDYLAASLHAAAGGLSPLDAYLQREMIVRTLAPPASLLVLSGC